MCVYKKKREYSDCLPALRIYDTIFIKRHVHRRMFHEQTSSCYSRTILCVVSLFPCLLLSASLLDIFFLPCIRSALGMYVYVCVFVYMLCGTIANSLCFIRTRGKKEVFFFVLSRSSTFVRRFFLLFSVDWKYGQKYTTSNIHTECCKFRFFFFLQFLFFLNGFLLVYLLLSCHCVSHDCMCSYSSCCVTSS